MSMAFRHAYSVCCIQVPEAAATGPLRGILNFSVFGPLQQYRFAIDTVRRKAVLTKLIISLQDPSPCASGTLISIY